MTVSTTSPFAPYMVRTSRWGDISTESLVYVLDVLKDAMDRMEPLPPEPDYRLRRFAQEKRYEDAWNVLTDLQQDIADELNARWDGVFWMNGSSSGESE